MKKSLTKLLSTLAMIGVAVLLTACDSASESSSPWVKSESPWGKRTAAVTDSAEVPPEADTNKQEGSDTEIGSSSGYDMAYQTEKVESIVPEEPIMDEPVVPPPAPAPRPSAVKKAAPAPAPVIAAAGSAKAGDDDFKSVAPEYYTLQVIASVDKKAVYAFARQHQLSTRYIVPTVRGGTTWHVLLLDVYPDKAAARTAMGQVAASLPDKPWMRTVASVQKLMP